MELLKKSAMIWLAPIKTLAKLRSLGRAVLLLLTFQLAAVATMIANPVLIGLVNVASESCTEETKLPVGSEAILQRHRQNDVCRWLASLAHLNHDVPATKSHDRIAFLMLDLSPRFLHLIGSGIRILC